MTEREFKQALDAIRPAPGADERIRQKLERELGGPLGERRVTVQTRRRLLPRVLKAAAVLLLIIGAAALLLWPQLRGVQSGPAPVGIPVPATPEPSPLMWFEDVPVSNEGSLKELLTVDYPLAELRGWFPELSRYEIIVFHKGEDLSTPTFAEVNERFPVQCLRWNDTHFYTVYKVREGGYFYVAWATSFPPDQVPDEPVVQNPAYYSFSFYFNEHPRPKEADFSSLVPGLSTGADVKAIDPVVEWGLLFSSWERSYSLLDDGRFIIVYYQNRELFSMEQEIAFEPYHSVDEMVIASVEVEEASSTLLSGSYLADILPKDLPFTLKEVEATPKPEKAEATLTAEEESAVEAVLSDVMWLWTPYSLSDYTEGQPDGVPELCSLIGTYVRTHRLSMDQMRGLLLGTEGLDGAYAEGYAAMLAALHERQPLQFDEAYFLVDRSVQAFLPSVFGIDEADPEAALQRERELFAALYSMTGRWLRANYGLDYERIVPSVAEMELQPCSQTPTEAVAWLYEDVSPAWAVLVPIEQGGSENASGTLTLYFGEREAQNEVLLLGKSFDEEPTPLMTVENGGFSFEPYPIPLNDPDWTETVRGLPLSAVPTLRLAEDFTVRFERGTRKSGLQLYDEQFHPLNRTGYGDTALLWAEPGIYYCVIEVCGSWASRLSTDVYRCVFKMIVPAGRPVPFTPGDTHDLTEARLRWHGEEYTITDADALARLESWLQSAEAMPGGAACPFGSVLTLTRADGSRFSCCPAEDSCGVVCADGAYYQYARGSEDFWALFGIDQWWTSAP